MLPYLAKIEQLRDCVNMHLDELAWVDGETPTLFFAEYKRMSSPAILLAHEHFRSAVASVSLKPRDIQFIYNIKWPVPISIFFNWLYHHIAQVFNKINENELLGCAPEDFPNHEAPYFTTPMGQVVVAYQKHLDSYLINRPCARVVFNCLINDPTNKKPFVPLAKGMLKCLPDLNEREILALEEFAKANES